MKYQLMWGGRWRPITALLQGTNVVKDPMRASAAVIFVEEAPGYAAVLVSPGEITAMPEETRPSKRPWAPIGD